MVAKQPDEFKDIGGESDFGTTAEEREQLSSTRETIQTLDRMGREGTTPPSTFDPSLAAPSLSKAVSYGAEDAMTSMPKFVQKIASVVPSFGAAVKAYGGFKGGLDYITENWVKTPPEQRDAIVKSLGEYRRDPDQSATPDDLARLDAMLNNINTGGSPVGYQAPTSMGVEYKAPTGEMPVLNAPTPDQTGAVTSFDKVGGTIPPATAGTVKTVDAATAADDLSKIIGGIPTAQGATASTAQFTPGQIPLQGAQVGQVGTTPTAQTGVLTPVQGAQAGQVTTGPTTGISRDLLNQLILQAQGQGPSAAQAQLQQATDANIRAMQAAAASQRGAFNPAALRQLEQERAMAQQQAAGQSAVLRAQEQQQAAQTATGLAGTLTGAETQAATTQAQLDTQTAIQNAALTGDMAKAAAELTTRVSMSNADRQAESQRLQANLNTQVNLQNAAQEAEYRKFVEGKEFDASMFNAEQRNKIGMQKAEFDQRNYETKVNQISEMFRSGKLAEAQAYQLQAQLDTQTAIANMETALKAAQGDQNAQVAMNGQVNDYILKKMQIGLSYEQAKADAALKFQELTNQANQFAAMNELERAKALEQAKQTAYELALRDRNLDIEKQKADQSKPASKSWFEKTMDGVGSVFKAVGSITSLFSQGGVVPGVAKVAGDSTVNDTVPAKLSPGEIVIPRSVVNQGMDGMKKFLESKLSEISGQAACGGYVGYESVLKAKKGRK